MYPIYLFYYRFENYCEAIFENRGVEGFPLAGAFGHHNIEGEAVDLCAKCVSCYAKYRSKCKKLKMTLLSILLFIDILSSVNNKKKKLIFILILFNTVNIFSGNIFYAETKYN